MAPADDDGAGTGGTGAVEGTASGANGRATDTLAADATRAGAPPAAVAWIAARTKAGAADDVLEAAALFGPDACFCTHSRTVVSYALRFLTNNCAASEFNGLAGFGSESSEESESKI